MKNVIVKELKKHIPQDTWEFLKAHKAMLVGGAITSILTKKEINDFDIYFKDRDSFVMALLDIRGLKDNLDVDEYPDDIEINFQHLDSFEFRYLCHTEKSVTFKSKYSEPTFQFIHQNFYQTVEDVFEDFDFTINMVGYDFELDEIVTHPDAMLHLSQRILVTNSGTKYPLISVLRTNKYQERGYTISKKEMIKLLLAVSKLEFNSYEDVGKHIGGMYGKLNISEVFDTSREFGVDEVLRQLSEVDFGDLSSIETDLKNYNFDNALLEIIAGEYYDNLPYTKFVRLINDELCSSYDRSYKYVVGEVHYPKLNHVSSSSNIFYEDNAGIYCAKGYSDTCYGDVFLEMQPLNPKENTLGEKMFGYKEGVLLKQIIPIKTKNEYYTWLEEEKGIPSDVLKYLKMFNV